MLKEINKSKLHILGILFVCLRQTQVKVLTVILHLTDLRRRKINSN